MYNETRLRDRQRKGKGTEDIELPYCEGLEVPHSRSSHCRARIVAQVISAAAVQRPPVLLEEGGSGEALGSSSASSDAPQGRQPRLPLSGRDGRRWGASCTSSRVACMLRITCVSQWET